MKGRKGSLPTLLALSVAAAIGGGSFAPVSHSFSSKPPQKTFAASWECTAAKHQDWKCSSKPGEPYADKLEQIATKRSSLRGSFANLMQTTIKKHTQEVAVHLTEREDPRTKHPTPIVDPIYNNIPSLDHQQALDNAAIAEAAEAALEEEKKHIEKTLPYRSLAETDWVSRLGSRSSWPEDQARLPEREETRELLASDDVSEEEVGRSVLLSEWLSKAKKRSSWADTPAGRGISDDDGKGERSIAMSRMMGKPAPIFDRDRRLSADDWLEDVDTRTAWSEPTGKDGVEEAEEEILAFSDKPDEQKADGEQADMTLVGSVTMPEEGKADNSEMPLSQDEQTIGDKVAQAEPVMEAPEPPKPVGFAERLLAHQANGSASFNGTIAPPRSVQSAQQGMPSFQMQMGQAQDMASMRPSMPPPEQVAPQWLPNVEVSPAERLAKAYPKTNSSPKRYMPWQQQNTSPEKWQHAPSDTALPNTGYMASRPANTFITPDDIPLPGRNAQQLPPSPMSESAHEGRVGRSWSLSGQMMAQDAPPVQNPVPDPVIVDGPDENWPAPRYTAGNRLAPQLPSYQSKPTWSGNRGSDEARSPAQSVPHNNSFRTYRRPPPVSPKDIYKLASSQEPTSAGYSTPRQQSPFHRAQKQAKEGPSSIDRFKESTREPAAFMEPVPQQKAAPQPRSIPQQPATPSGYLPGLQHASFAPQPVMKASVRDMLNAPKNSVSVQWLATTQPAHITRFKQRYPILKDATVVRFLSGGQTWHLILSGIFPDVPTAMTYLHSEELKGMAKQLNPWTRPLSGLKKLNLLRHDIAVSPSAKLAPAPKPAALPQGQYTIQWMSAANPALLKHLKQRFSQLADAEVVMLNRNNKVQYLLIQGRYGSHQAVTQALQTPALFSLSKQMKPKARPMASLKHNTSIVRQPVITQVSVPMDRQTSQILNAPEGSFTIQWLAAHKPKVLDKLKARYPSLSSAETVHFRRNDKDWYVLVQGQYATYKDAKKALKSPQMQELSGKLKPWTRKISGLRTIAGT